MESIVSPYSSAIYALGAVAILAFVQLIIADVTGITRKHVPGTAIQGGHSDLLFRVARTVANTNESLAIFVCALLFCVLGGASPDYTAYSAWAYFTARLVYAGCYYADLRVLRSLSFAFVLFSIVALILTGYTT